MEKNNIPAEFRIQIIENALVFYRAISKIAGISLTQ